MNSDTTPSADALFDLRVRRLAVARQVIKTGAVTPVLAGTVSLLRNDLASGQWAARNGHLIRMDAADLGLRLLVG